ncbi:MAG TPA: hypothetical protein VGL03_06730 [Thermoanaerobaculia bacterium]
MKTALVSLIGLLASVSAFSQSKSPNPPNDPPETVIVTYRAKPGSEDALEKVIRKHWATVRRLKLVTEDVHLLYRGEDEPGKTFFVNVFTWKNHDAPDNAPPEVEAVWAEMQPLVEARGGHRGIEHPEVKAVPLSD